MIERMSETEALAWMAIARDPNLPAEDRHCAADIVASWICHQDAKAELARVTRKGRIRRLFRREQQGR